MFAVLNLLIVLLVVAGVVSLLWYGFSQLPLPPMARTIAIVVLCVLGAVLLLSFLTNGVQIPLFIKG
jgi:hypothetical protein